MDPTLLQFFLLLNVFLIGAASALAIKHAYAHFKPEHHDAEKHRAHEQPQGGHLPVAVRQQLLQQSQANFQAVLDRSTAELQHDLQSTATQLNKQLEKIGNRIVADEMKRYESSLDKLRSQAQTTISTAQSSIEKHQAELEAKLTRRQTEMEAQIAQRKAELETALVEEMAAEKQRLIAQIDTRLADAVASFLTETLQHNVDLGAQSTYLTAMLEEHKAELTRGVKDEA